MKNRLNSLRQFFMALVRAILLGLLINLPISATDDRQAVDERKAAATDGFVGIKVLRGRLSVIGWDKKEIHVSGFLDEELREFVFEVDGNDARIEVKIPGKSDGWTDEGSDLAIHIPEGSNLDISSISADIRVNNIRNGLEVGNVSGDIIISDVKGRIEVSSVSGEVELRNAAGKAYISTVSGDIEAYHTGSGTYGTVSGELRLDGVGEELELKSVSGDIEVNSESYRQINGHSISGDVEISGELETGGSIEFDNVSGSIRLQLAGGIDAGFDIETGSGGSIRNRLTDDEPKVSKYVRNESLKFTLGEGRGEVILGTASGDITLTH